jgi:predicted GNAT family acetyltransferase
VEVAAFASAAAFAEAVFPALERHEAEHNLILGITERLAQGGRGGWAESATAASFWAVFERGEVIGAALVTPPYDLVLSRCAPGAASGLAAFLRERAVALPGVTGTREAADEFASAWATVTGTRAAIRRYERIYEIREVTAPSGVSGKGRLAKRSDLALLAGWLDAFAAFTGDPTDATAAASDAIERQRALFWHDPEPTSVAVWGRTTRTGASIGPVYTPPEYRRRGYGSAVTAALSARLLEAGRTFCCLYTDIANPTSNRIYQQIGYRPVVDVSHYRFAGP